MLGIELPELVRAVGYTGVTAAIFLESGVIIGVFFPGASLLFTAGLLASQGVFNIWILVPLLMVAAIAGDSTGYWFGRKVGPALFTRHESFFFKPSHVARAREFFEKHGPQTIIMARFVPIVRTFAPILAGVGSMNYSLFFRYNVIGASAFAAGVTLVGYTLGSRIPAVADYLSYILIAIVFFSCVPLLLHYFGPRDNPPPEQK
jgi:membrane-associated protein